MCCKNRTTISHSLMFKSGLQIECFFSYQHEIIPYERHFLLVNIAVSFTLAF